MPNGTLVRLDAKQRALRAQHGDDALARLEPIDADEISGHAASGVAILPQSPVLIDHHGRRQPMALPDVEIVGVVRGGDLHDARAECRIGVFVGDDRAVDVHDRQSHRLADQGYGFARKSKLQRGFEIVLA